MTENGMRVRLALFAIVVHFIALGLIVVLFFAKGFLFEEMTTCLGITAPMFAGQTALAYRWIMNNRIRRADRSKRITMSVVFVSFVIPLLFVLTLGGATMAKAFNFGFASFEDFKIFLGAIEAFFGIWFGTIVSDWFKAEKIERDVGAKLAG